MIKLGSLGCLPRARRRTSAYTRVRRTSKRRPPIGDTGAVTFGSPEFPTATLRDRGAWYLLGDWMHARWTWIRPRTIPLAVAFAGMLAVLGSMHYLSAPRGWSTAVIQLDRPGKQSTFDPPSVEIQLDRDLTPSASELRWPAIIVR